MANLLGSVNPDGSKTYARFAKVDFDPKISAVKNRAGIPGHDFKSLQERMGVGQDTKPHCAWCSGMIMWKDRYAYIRPMLGKREAEDPQVKNMYTSAWHHAVKASKFQMNQKKTEKAARWAMAVVSARSSRIARVNPTGTPAPTAKQLMDAMENSEFRKAIDWVVPLVEEMDIFMLYGCKCSAQKLLELQPQLVEEVKRLKIEEPMIVPIFAKSWYLTRPRYSDKEDEYGITNNAARTSGGRRWRTARTSTNGSAVLA